jgi:hypothetical protein
VDPGAAGGRAVPFKLVVAREERAVGLATGDLHEHVLGVWLVVWSLEWVVPGQVEDRPVLWILRAGQLLADPLAKVVDPVKL